MDYQAAPEWNWEPSEADGGKKKIHVSFIVKKGIGGPSGWS